MARPKKLYEGENQTMGTSYHSVKHLVQPLAIQPGSAGRPAVEVDAKVSEWIDAGYTLVTAFPYANAPDYIQMVYVLVKQPIG